MTIRSATTGCTMTCDECGHWVPVNNAADVALTRRLGWTGHRDPHDAMSPATHRCAKCAAQRRIAA
jgi:hypothetical protein